MACKARRTDDLTPNSMQSFFKSGYKVAAGLRPPTSASSHLRSLYLFAPALESHWLPPKLLRPVILEIRTVLGLERSVVPRRINPPPIEHLEVKAH